MRQESIRLTISNLRLPIQRLNLFLAEKSLSLSATLDKQAAYEGASFIIVATPTNYDPEPITFDTSSVDTVVEAALKAQSDALVVIKVDYSCGPHQVLQEKLHRQARDFSPEFLREGRAFMTTSIHQE